MQFQPVEAIQMGTNNKKYPGCNLKTTELLDCALIGVCAVIRSNRVFFLCHTSVHQYCVIKAYNLRQRVHAHLSPLRYRLNTEVFDNSSR